MDLHEKREIWARICKPLKEAQESIPSLTGRYDIIPIWRTACQARLHRIDSLESIPGSVNVYKYWTWVGSYLVVCKYPSNKNKMYTLCEKIKNVFVTQQMGTGTYTGAAYKKILCSFVIEEINQSVR